MWRRLASVRDSGRERCSPRLGPRRQPGWSATCPASRRAPEYSVQELHVAVHGGDRQRPGLVALAHGAALQVFVERLHDARRDIAQRHAAEACPPSTRRSRGARANTRNLVTIAHGQKSDTLAPAYPLGLRQTQQASDPLASGLTSPARFSTHRAHRVRLRRQRCDSSAWSSPCCCSPRSGSLRPSSGAACRSSTSVADTKGASYAADQPGPHCRSIRPTLAPIDTAIGALLVVVGVLAAFWWLGP